MNSDDLAAFISRHGIAAELVWPEEKTPTVAAAATAVGVHPRQIIKSVLFFADGEPVLVITNGLTRIQRKSLADALGTSRRRVKIADPDQVLATTGYPVGAVPPFGHRQPLRTLVDQGVLAETAVFGGGGEINALMRVTTAELQRVVRGTVVSIADR